MFVLGALLFISGVEAHTWPTQPEAKLFSSDDSFWGASPILDDNGTVHVFASRFTHHCGLDTWQTNSECVRATSSNGPTGPFTVQETVVPAFCHNPTIRRYIDGSYLLYYIGNDHTSRYPTTDCLNGTTLQKVPNYLDTAPCNVWVRRALTLQGPWSKPFWIYGILDFFPFCRTNPSPVVLDNGRVYLFFRGYPFIGGEHIFGVTAETWNSHYGQTIGSPHLPVQAEDPFAWFSAKTHTWHMLYSNKFNDAMNVGGYACSVDAESCCDVQPKAAYSLQADYEDGSSFIFQRRERPQLLMLDDTHGYLYTAVRPFAANDSTYTLIVPWTTDGCSTGSIKLS